ncbi:MAG: hypothetical protein ACRCXB_26745 [Aeromonadaceae bacterium]
MGEMQQGAFDSILEVGKIARYVRRASTQDPVTGDMTTTEIEQALPTVMLPDDEVMSNGVIAGSAISQKSRKCIAAAMEATFDLRSGDVLVWGGEEWTILGATPLDPDGSGAIIYQFGVSK